MITVAPVVGEPGRVRSVRPRRARPGAIPTATAHTTGTTAAENQAPGPPVAAQTSITGNRTRTRVPAPATSTTGACTAFVAAGERRHHPRRVAAVAAVATRTAVNPRDTGGHAASTSTTIATNAPRIKRPHAACVPAVTAGPAGNYRVSTRAATAAAAEQRPTTAARATRATGNRARASGAALAAATDRGEQTRVTTRTTATALPAGIGRRTTGTTIAAITNERQGARHPTGATTATYPADTGRITSRTTTTRRARGLAPSTDREHSARASGAAHTTGRRVVCTRTTSATEAPQPTGPPAVTASPGIHPCDTRPTDTAIAQQERRPTEPAVPAVPSRTPQAASQPTPARQALIAGFRGP